MRFEMDIMLGSQHASSFKIMLWLNASTFEMKLHEFLLCARTCSNHTGKGPKGLQNAI